MKQNIQINFPNSLNGVGIDSGRKFNFLTISILLGLNNGCSNIIKIQEDLLRDINFTTSCGSGIYKYPSNQIHFSVINFERFKSLSSTGGKQQFYAKNQSQIEKIKFILNKFDKRKITDKTVQFAYIFTGNDKYKPESLALQAFPSIQLYQLFEEINFEFNECAGLAPAIIKDNGFSRFPVNLIRFFNNITNKEEEIISSSVLDFNNRCDQIKNDNMDKFYETKINHISFVFSDNWLSNENPEIFYIELK